MNPEASQDSSRDVWGCTKPPPESTHCTSHWTPFKITARKIQISHKSMVSDLCSVLISEWETLGIQDWAPLPELQDQGRAGFHGHREALFAYLPPVASSGVGPLGDGSAQSRHKASKTMTTVTETDVVKNLYVHLFLLRIHHTSLSSLSCRCSEHAVFPHCCISLAYLYNLKEPQTVVFLSI